MERHATRAKASSAISAMDASIISSRGESPEAPDSTQATASGSHSACGISAMKGRRSYGAIDVVLDLAVSDLRPIMGTAAHVRVVRDSQGYDVARPVLRIASTG